VLARLFPAASAAALLSAAVVARQPFRYDVEYPFIQYTARAPAERVAALRARLARGEVRLPAGPRGYLDAVLRALEIDAASQMLVFSKTSLQAG
jgi:hypothetical protein